MHFFNLTCHFGYQTKSLLTMMIAIISPVTPCNNLKTLSRVILQEEESHSIKLILSQASNR